MSVSAASYGRFFQLGYVVRDIDAAAAGLVKRMGAVQVDLIHDFADPQGRPVAVRNLAHLALPGAEIELIQPRLDWPSIYLDALPDHDEDVGFHHLGFLVPDQQAWDQAMESLEAMDTPIVMEGGTPKVRFAYIDTRRQAGHYSELVLRFNPTTASQ